MEQNDKTKKVSSKSTRKKVENLNEISTPISKYRLYLYTTRGLLRSDISRGLFADYSLRYGDIMRAIPSNNWWTADEITNYYFTLEKRFKFEKRRTPDQIRDALLALVEAGLVKSKS